MASEVKDVEEEKQQNIFERDFSKPSVGDIYEYCHNNFLITKGKRFEIIKIINFLNKTYCKFKELSGDFDLSTTFQNKKVWNLCYKADFNFQPGDSITFPNGSKMQYVETKFNDAINKDVIWFKNRNGSRANTKDEIAQKVLDGEFVVNYARELVSSGDVTLKPGPIEFPTINEDLVAEIAKQTKFIFENTKINFNKEKSKMNLIERMNIEDVQFTEIDEEVIKDKAKELASLFGYEATVNKQQQVIFREAGKLTKGIQVTPVSLIEMFTDRIKNGSDIQSSHVLECAINYGIVKKISLISK